ncbi:M17 family metallopeptidase [Cohnella sp. REN36]|uniref:leucyl aminopeptidase family protein n=1 Tax=Cohnella sp. REN36 TaxID=2887347 RepID=UPI001D137503|nr:leucyl aminopeptidase family protein [Cohnella sp. REN36]MCC3372604.1 leucyl aminopeptidase family protein [Cohnella sp. REN36]
MNRKEGEAMKIGIDSAAEAEVLVYPVYPGETFPYKLGDGKRSSGSATWLLGRTETERDALAVGMGERADLTLERVRRAAGTAARALRREGRMSALLVREPGGGDTAGIAAADWLQAWTEGWLLGLYRYEAFREATKDRGPAALDLRAADWPELTPEAMEAAVATGRLRAEGTMVARGLVNESPVTLHPDRFADWIAEYFDRGDPALRVRVYRGQELVDRRMSGLLAVGAGSRHRPALVELRYEGDPALPLLALVGKGVTFDMGGMNAKTASDITDARMDMGGAAAVVGAMDILARGRARANVVALLPVADNVPDAAAILPSTVLRYPNGLTVEVANTDGEGRLLLADALLHAANLGAAETVDIATLTGNVGAALGLGIAGIWGDEDVSRRLVAIGERNGERLWPMPLMDEYESELRSPYADLRNVGRSPYGGAILAALFIRRFVAPGMRWAHIDMAGTVQYKQDESYAETGATGYGARLLADYAVQRADEARRHEAEETQR